MNVISVMTTFSPKKTNNPYLTDPNNTICSSITYLNFLRVWTEEDAARGLFIKESGIFLTFSIWTEFKQDQNDFT